jgi:hypothetical protein
MLITIVKWRNCLKYSFNLILKTSIGSITILWKITRLRRKSCLYLSTLTIWQELNRLKVCVPSVGEIRKEVREIMDSA